ncbi:MAG TPA: hypothetical protein VLM40_07415 [Gemmata sp.]|nr:hypothetical protein [Gemmata sp.]
MARLTVPLVMICVVAFHSTVSAQRDVGSVQPDCLPLGTLHIGGRAEASFLIYAPADDPNPKVKVDAPKFVKVLRTDTSRRTVGDTLYTGVMVEIAVETARAGEFKGDIAVTVDKAVTKLPISATVKAPRPGTPRLLVVGGPFRCDSYLKGAAFKGWTDVVNAANLDVSYLLVWHGKAVLRDIDLGKYNCVLMDSGALVFQSTEDVARVRKYAENGGRVVVAANHFMVGSVKGANAVLAGSGLEMIDEEPPPRVRHVTLGKEDFAPDVVKAGVDSATFFRASPIDAVKGGHVLVKATGYDRSGTGLAASAKVGKGEVIALGVSLWWSWVSAEEAKGSGNGKLLRFLLVPSRGAS